MEKLILLWLPLQGDVQCRDISSERYIVIICKLISTCDLMRRGFSLRRPGRASLRSVVLGRLRGSKYISLYCIASQLQIETQTGHLLPSYKTKRKKKNHSASNRNNNGNGRQLQLKQNHSARLAQNYS